jgi:hypothetical protein
LTDGVQGLELVRILEASSESLKQGGAPVEFAKRFNGNGSMPPLPGLNAPRTPDSKAEAPRLNGRKRPGGGRKLQMKISSNGHKS